MTTSAAEQLSHAYEVDAAGGAALCNQEVLQSVFQFVGPRQFLIMAAVSTYWKQQYLEVPLEGTFNPFSCSAAARYKRRACVRHKGSGCTAYSAVFASRQLLHMAHECGLLDLHSSSVQCSAGQHASQAVLQVAHELGMPSTAAVRPLYAPELTLCAASSGSVQVLTWLEQFGAYRYADHCETSACAAKAGHAHVLHHMHWQSSYVHTPRIASIAAVRGNTGIFQFLYEFGRYNRSVGQAVLVQAASSGSVELMQWLVQHGVQLDASAMPPAVYCGHLDMCTYLRSQGCAWTSELTAAAIAHNRADIVSWAVAEGPAELTAEQQSSFDNLPQTQLNKPQSCCDGLKSDKSLPTAVKVHYEQMTQQTAHAYTFSD
eukprot:2011-Heterococcus_DN1.PRE.1